MPCIFILALKLSELTIPVNVGDAKLAFKLRLVVKLLVVTYEPKVVVQLLAVTKEPRVDDSEALVTKLASEGGSEILEYVILPVIVNVPLILTSVPNVMVVSLNVEAFNAEFGFMLIDVPSIEFMAST